MTWNSGEKNPENCQSLTVQHLRGPFPGQYDLINKKVKSDKVSHDHHYYEEYL